MWYQLRRFRSVCLQRPKYEVTIQDLAGRAIHNEFSVTEEDGARAKGLDCRCGMGYEQHRRSVIHHRTDCRVALGLKELVTNGKSLIDDQNLGIKMHLDGKSKPYKHTAGIGFHRLVKVIPNIGEFHDIS